MRDSAVSPCSSCPVRCYAKLRCVKGSMYSSNLQRPLSLEIPEISFVCVCLGIICASYRHFAPFCCYYCDYFPFDFVSIFKYQLAFFGSLILGLWFFRSFQILSTPLHARCVPSKCPASVVSVRFSSFQVKKGNCEGQRRRLSKEKWEKQMRIEKDWAARLSCLGNSVEALVQKEKKERIWIEFSIFMAKSRVS